MTPIELLTHLREKDIRLWAENGKLKFNAPKGALTPELRAELVANKPALLEMLQAAARSATTTAAIPKISREAPLTPSYMQERLWLLDRLDPGTPVYNMTAAWRLQGPLQPEILETSLQAMIRRHESLRTIFSQDKQSGLPIQKILPIIDSTLTITNLASLPSTEQETAVKQAIIAEHEHRFDLETGPLFRATLLQCGPDHHIILLNMHHIITDGWSWSVFYRELSTLYKAKLNDNPNPLPPLAVQYADFAAWQKERLQSKTLAAQVDYWQEQLTGAPPQLELPTDYPRPAMQSYRGDKHRYTISADIAQPLRALSQREGASYFMTLLAAFKLLLHRLSDQDDLVVGVPIAGRGRSELETMIGYFINMLPLRTAVNPEQSFTHYLRHLREASLQAYEHQEVPFEKVLEVLQPERDLGRTPIFQVTFNMLTLDEAKPNLPDITATRLPGSDPLSKFDMTIYLEERGDELDYLLVYNTDLFSHARMAEFTKQYAHLLRQIAANPQRPLKAYSLITPDAQTRLPDPERPLSAAWSNSVATLFSRQAQQTPDQLALTDTHGQWTYAQLERRSNQLAHTLQAQGIGQGDIVAVYADRTASLPLALLGIWKAGAAFLILDPAYPPPRLRYYLDTAQPKGWLQLATAPPLDKELANWLDNANLACRLTLPATPAANATLDQKPDNLPATTTGPDDLAYLIFTSGTTGQPKGIQGRHSPLSHFFSWQIETFSLRADDQFSLLSGLAHDPLLRDIFTPLLVGATLHVPTQDDMLQPGHLARWLADQRITVAHLTPALGQVAALDFRDPATNGSYTAVSLPKLRYAFFGGDRLSRDDVDSLHKIAPNATAVNFYGATETPQAMAYHIAAHDTPSDNSSKTVPIGQGIADVQLLVINQQQLAGIGEPGEIYIRTPYLAQGYWRDDQQTAARFVPNPLTNDPTDTVYRTGDLGRYLPDGTVKFHGRADRQIKIRGFRVEPSEIETVLNQQPNITQSIVTIYTDTAGQQQLTAYVVTKTGKDADNNALRNALAAALPAYMVPTAFVTVDQMPLTPNGKIDTDQLPDPDLATIATAQHGYTPPNDPVENKLVDIWEAVLKVKPIGIHDNYFELGGHSLQTIALFTRIERAFQQSIPLATIFQAPTIAQLAEILRQAGEKMDWSSLVPISPKGSKQPFFCVHGGAGHVYHYRALAQHLGPDQPFYGLQPANANSNHTFGGDVASMATNYLREIRQVQPEGPYHLGGFCFGGVVAFEMAQQLKRAGEEVALVAIIDAFSPDFDRRTPASESDGNWWQRQKAAIAQSETTIAKINYFMSSLKRRLKKTFQEPVVRRWLYLRHKIRIWLIQWHERQERPLPHDLRNYQTIAANRQARMRYTPETYPGNLAIFRRHDISEFVPDDMGWRDLTGGSLHIHEIPGHHLDLLQEPAVQELAQSLRNSLEQSHQTTPSLEQNTPT